MNHLQRSIFNDWLATGDHLQEIGNRYGVDKSCVSRCIDKGRAEQKINKQNLNPHGKIEHRMDRSNMEPDNGMRQDIGRL